MPHQLQPCGTFAAYQRHIYHKEVPCEPCREACNSYSSATRVRKGRRVAQCGTYGGYLAHWRRKEPACEPCHEARRVYRRSRDATLALTPGE